MGSKTETKEMPEFQKRFLEETVIPFAQDFLGTPYESYTGERVAGLTPLQQQALSGYGALSLPSELATASGVVEGVATMTPEELSAQRAQYAQEYTDLIMDPTRRRLKREQDIARSTEAGQMTRALGGAGFGASRRGVAEGEREAARDVAMGELEARIAGQGLDYGTQRLMSDIGLRTGAAGQLAGLGQQSFGYGQQIQDQQMRQGAVQQAAMQQLIDAGRQQYQGYENAPTQKMQLPLQALGMVPYSTSQTTTGGGTQQSFNPGLFNYLQVGASMFG